MSTTGKTHSNALTEDPSRAMLRGVGFSRKDLGKPIIGIANTWTEVGPCNFFNVSDAEIAKRLKNLTPPAPRYQRGVFARYTNTVSSAGQGAVTT